MVNFETFSIKTLLSNLWINTDERNLFKLNNVHCNKQTKVNVRSLLATIKFASEWTKKSISTRRIRMWPGSISAMKAGGRDQHFRRLTLHEYLVAWHKYLLTLRCLCILEQWSRTSVWKCLQALRTLCIRTPPLEWSIGGNSNLDARKNETWSPQANIVCLLCNCNRHFSLPTFICLWTIPYVLQPAFS